ncbi:hypothetical protein AAFF_G00280400 [Aldrovandia affinis]|uniref:Uncharacterized protein n=1 Tax=Aldrovandia affinis TaxID=143900 RepID=A0AAD7RA94_9TELE|nr:hypothetical protein AAFF_G00280400 [Aldrovandia affinis]
MWLEEGRAGARCKRGTRSVSAGEAYASSAPTPLPTATAPPLRHSITTFPKAAPVTCRIRRGADIGAHEWGLRDRMPRRATADFNGLWKMLGNSCWWETSARNLEAFVCSGAAQLIQELADTHRNTAGPRHAPSPSPPVAVTVSGGGEALAPGLPLTPALASQSSPHTRLQHAKAQEMDEESMASAVAGHKGNCARLEQNWDSTKARPGDPFRSRLIREPQECTLKSNGQRPSTRDFLQ